MTVSSCKFVSDSFFLRVSNSTKITASRIPAFCDTLTAIKKPYHSLTQFLMVHALQELLSSNIINMCL